MSEKVLTEKQSNKNQRVKSYFVQAAKDIIMKEGVENVSVRKIADQAGYTFTTIYKYFDDINELLQCVKAEMIQDLMKYMTSSVPPKNCSLAVIKKLNRIYLDYYIERPNIFTFFYSYRLHPMEGNHAEMMDYGLYYQETYRGFVRSGVINEVDIPVIAKTIIFTLHGLLALYFSDNGMTKKVVYEELDQTIDYLLKGV